MACRNEVQAKLVRVEAQLRGAEMEATASSHGYQQLQQKLSKQEEEAQQLEHKLSDQDKDLRQKLSDQEEEAQQLRQKLSMKEEEAQQVSRNRCYSNTINIQHHAVSMTLDVPEVFF